MALIVWDGFDHYAALLDLQSRVGALFWGQVVAGGVSFPAGRGGYGQCVELVSGEDGILLGGSFNQNFGAAISAIAMLIAPNSGAYIDFQAMDYTAGAAQLTLRVLLASGTVIAYLGDPNADFTQIAASPPNACNPFVWQKYEFKVVIGSSGSFDFHVNGNSVLSASGTNTQFTANAWFNGIQFRGGVLVGIGGPTASFDDFNHNDLTTGPGTYPCNDFIGDCATRTLRTTGNSSVQWTPLSGTNWGEVNEVQLDGDITYNYASAVGDKDLFTFGALPTTVSAVFGVQITGAYRKLDASSQTVVQNLVSGGAATIGGTWVMSLNYTYITDPFVLDPNTSATWITTAVNSLTAGYTLNS